MCGRDHGHKCRQCRLTYTHMQVIRRALLLEGFEAVRSQGLAVTDDVSIVEALGKPVKITQGSYMNIKVRMSVCIRVCVFACMCICVCVFPE